MEDKRKLLIIQPFLTKYRLPVFSELATKYQVVVGATLNDSYGSIEQNDLCSIEFEPLISRSFFQNRIFYQFNLFKIIKKHKPDIAFLTANGRYISLWLILLVLKSINVKVILHGQGLYNKKKISLFSRIQYFLFSVLSDKYICYTESCQDTLKSLSIYKNTEVADNSIVNEYPVNKITTDEKGVLFIGRLRHGCNIEFLIEAIDALVDEEMDIKLFIVGGGELLNVLREKYISHQSIDFLGEIYDPQKISEISKHCFAGCYPGDAGLSVLHYMSLSLPAIIHSSLDLHMGPEPSYIKDNVNGYLFKRGDKLSLIDALLNTNNHKKHLNVMQQNAFSSYQKLTDPSLGQRFLRVIDMVMQEGR